MITRNSLGVFWRFEEGYEEVDGLYFYGKWLNHLPRKIALERLEKTWEKETAEYNTTSFDNDEYKVYAITIYIKEFPESNNWFNVIRETLQMFTDQGAVFAWCGTELSSPNPIIFTSEEGGEVYAFYSEKTGFICNAGLEDEMKDLTAEQIKRIYQLFW